RWLAATGLDLEEVGRRHSLVGEFVAQPGRLAEIIELLSGVRDIPRIMGRLQNRLRNPRELCGIRDSLEQLPRIAQALAAIGPGAAAVRGRIHELGELRALLTASLADEPPADVSEGNFVREGYDAELDRMRALMSGNKSWLADLERGEQERTGIRSLKVRFTNNFGYYIEVTKANLHLVPSDYVRRQTTVGGERYVTEALRQKEREILHAEENALAREKEILEALITAVLAQSAPLSQTADALAEVDVLAGWASLAREWGYCRPEVDEGETLEIMDGRHPVVEQGFRSGEAGLATTRGFVPNDTDLACGDAQIALITGPNMAGKSTYIRQVALIALMAQVGSWVPAKSLRLGMVDRIFSRVGASDDLARGNSTFMVEMNETANILNNATDRSLIILDEIGRGTSTYDGLSIAWAVVEHLHRDPTQGPRTLFATHYQELTQLDKHLPRMRNLSVSVREANDEIVFVRRVVPGAADRSYGIQVARLAGLPPTVIERAKVILGRLEGDESTITVPSPQARPKKKIRIEPADSSQLDLL
ncbi:MAG TPA: DNA mismatch repair protein MutS, partial [Opitutaceae bacterium]